MEPLSNSLIEKEPKNKSRDRPNNKKVKRNEQLGKETVPTEGMEEDEGTRSAATSHREPGADPPGPHPRQ
eukprot:3721534-Rhodomonas_salina.1